MPEVIAIGCDVSKGRIDVVIRNQAGTRLAGCDAYDDTRRGHERLRRIVDDLYDHYPDSTILVGLEATGGMERNWISFFRGEQRWVKALRIHRINALSLARHRQAQLHRAPGDIASAEAIVNYLLDCCVRRKASPIAEHGPTGFYRSIRSLILDQIRCRQRLHAMLVVANPEVIQYTRSRFPEWLYELLDRYPTAAHLARAHASTIDGIRYVNAERAHELIAEAKTSVASQTDPSTAAAIKLMIGTIRDFDRRIEAGKKELNAILAAEKDSPITRAARLLDSIPCLGSWTAVMLACEIGDVSRFAGDRSLIAWAGLDPVIEASGDDVVNRGISHRGNSHVRAVLFMIALSLIQTDSPFAATYHRLVARGKPRLVALVAVMTKLLRVAYALLVSGKPYDCEYAMRVAAPAAEAAQEARSIEQPAAIVETSNTTDAKAPVSRLEAKRRKVDATTPAVPKAKNPKPSGAVGRIRRPATVAPDHAKG